jgi:hypothetical protein
MLLSTGLAPAPRKVLTVALLEAGSRFSCAVCTASSMWALKVGSSFPQGPVCWDLSITNLYSVPEWLAHELHDPQSTYVSFYRCSCNFAILGWDGVGPIFSGPSCQISRPSIDSNRLCLHVCRLTGSVPVPSEPAIILVSRSRDWLCRWTYLPLWNSDYDKEAAEEHPRTSCCSYLCDWAAWRCWCPLCHWSCCADFGD